MNALKSLVDEMENRYQTFAGPGFSTSAITDVRGITWPTMWS